MKSLIVPIFLAASQVFAQSAPTTFPSDAVLLSPVSLHEALAGKVYTVKLADGTRWRWQFKGDGLFYLNVGTFSDSGKWSTKESALCSEGRQVAASCNEVRQLGSDLLLKRDNGTVVTMSPQ